MRNTGVPAIDFFLAFTPLAVAFTAFAVGGVANAVNIIDGFNGLASGSVAIMFTGMGLIALNVGDGALAGVCFTVVAVMLGFGAINWPMGHIFLGDGGAYLVGFILAWVAVLMPMRHPGVTAWATLLVCAYPVLEVAFSYRRKSKRVGHHPGQPDKVHLHMLMYRRLSRKAYPKASQTLQNGLTSIYAWCYAAIPVVWAVTCFDRVGLLALGFVASAGIYWAIYQRLSQFKWCFEPSTMHAAQTNDVAGGATL
jgi:UDP-N-acetylmuramyl pentapeptide phosphotransferase/UDP-N-acetylglucosamine-1-phosphate transferase